MAESKTARASMRAGFVKESKTDPFDTPEKKIAELRKQRAANLFVNRMDFVDALYEEYEKVQLLLAQEIANVVVLKEALRAYSEQPSVTPDCGCNDPMIPSGAHVEGCVLYKRSDA